MTLWTSINCGSDQLLNCKSQQRQLKAGEEARENAATIHGSHCSVLHTCTVAAGWINSKLAVACLSAVAASVGLGACGDGSGAPAPTPAAHADDTRSATTKVTRSHPLTIVSAAAAAGTTGAAPRSSDAVAAPSYARLLNAALITGPMRLATVATWLGKPVAWMSRTASVTVMSFDQQVLRLHLHSGTLDAGPTGWRFGPSVAGSEMGHMLAAFNGGFKFTTDSGGFTSYGRVAVSPRDGFGSVVTYANGRTDIGSWGSEVPKLALRVVSVRQNLPLLIDKGRAASNLGCLICWGATLGGVVDPARSSLGITADGRLVWVAGEHLTVVALADALLRAGAVRAVELDINPYWVAGYLYGHRGGRGPLAPVPVVAGQSGIPGQYLAPWNRDFFTIVVP